MRRASAGSWALPVVGSILCAGFIAGCGGGSTGSSASTDNSSSITAVQNSSVTLNWQPPTENTDGTALTDLSGYVISYGTQSGTYPNNITLDNPGLTTYIVDNLTPGTYYFTITATASDGTESEPSPAVAVQVD